MQAPADAAVLAADQILAGRYRLVRPLGEGGIGVVWEARHLTTEKAVALKVLKTRDHEGLDRVRFLREAKVAAGLSHRNIVQVFDFWDQEDGPAFLVMELLNGETLAAVLARGGLRLVDTLNLLVPVANALAAAHAAGVVHRDLKPENVLLARTSDNQIDVKVLDFGLAKPVVPETGATALTSTGSLMGTPFYMAPEQVYGEKNIGVAADVWAFGVLIYECLTGTRPFSGENFGQIFRSITQTSPRPVHELAPHVPLGISTMVQRMLAHDVGARPTMSELSATLGSFARGEVLQPTQSIVSPIERTASPRTVALSPVTSPSPTMIPALSDSVPTTTASSRSLIAAVTAIAGGLLVVIVLLFAVRGGRGGGAPTIVKLPPPPSGVPAAEAPLLPAAIDPAGVPSAIDAATTSAKDDRADVEPASRPASPPPRSQAHKADASAGTRTPAPARDPLSGGRF